VAVEIADVFRRFGEEYLARYGLGILPSHHRAIKDITACRTPDLGGHLWHCEDCGQDVYVYHGCRNRSCPACHTTQTNAWLEARRIEVLPSDHFHVTTTVPEELRGLFRHRQKALYGLFMRVSAEAILTLCRDPKHLGATPALLAVLHTWTGRLDYHPHVHFLVTAGGLGPDGLKWVPSKPGFLVPVKALSRLIRHRMRQALTHEQPDLYQQIPDSVWTNEWVVNCLPWAGAEEGVLNYLARYVFRIAITNHRVVSMDGESVTFKYKDRKKRRLRTCTLSGVEFMRRYLQHVLPKGFHKVRYYGLWHPALRKKIALIRQLLLLESKSSEPIGAQDSPVMDPQDSPEPYAPRACPHCRGTNLVYRGNIPRPRFRGS
jgi:hypothetical protein